jgi:hypothetical protein
MLDFWIVFLSLYSLQMKCHQQQGTTKTCFLSFCKKRHSQKATTSGLHHCMEELPEDYSLHRQ